MASYYGTIQKAEDYFNDRLHETAWSQATATDRPKALLAATRIIDQLNFKGLKATVHTLLEADSDATQKQIRAAEASQELEFPRGADTVVPQDIELACFEIAHSLLDGKDPEQELENLSVNAHTFGPVRTTFNRDQQPIEHLINYCPNPLAWRWLKPFLRNSDAIKLSRIG